MNALINGTTLLLTILAALGLGILAGQYAISVILHLLAPRPLREPSVLPQEHPAHGD